MTKLPGGTVTFLFTDVDHSTELVKNLQERYSAVLAKHRDVLRAAVADYGGSEVDTQGDAFFVAFGRARDAVEAAVAAQRALADSAWPDEAQLSVRMGLHTGEPYRAEHGYTGVAVHRAARICTIAHGGQVLLSRATAGIIDDEEIAGVSVRDVGEYRLKDFDRPDRIYQLVVEGLPADFRPPRTADRQIPLTGTITVVMTEGRRMMRLFDELPQEQFAALLDEYQRLIRNVLEEAGGGAIEVVFDSVMAAFPSAKQAAHAAAETQRALSKHEWPYRLRPEMSVGLHSGEAAIGWLGPAALRCAELCDTAEGGQIFASQATASLLEGEKLGELSLCDLGERQARRTGKLLHVYELIHESATEAT